MPPAPLAAACLACARLRRYALPAWRPAPAAFPPLIGAAVSLRYRPPARLRSLRSAFGVPFVARCPLARRRAWPCRSLAAASAASAAPWSPLVALRAASLPARRGASPPPLRSFGRVACAPLLARWRLPIFLCRGYGLRPSAASPRRLRTATRYALRASGAGVAGLAPHLRPPSVSASAPATHICRGCSPPAAGGRRRPAPSLPLRAAPAARSALARALRYSLAALGALRADFMVLYCDLLTKLYL